MLSLIAALLIIITVCYLVFFVFFPLGRGAVFFPSRRSHAQRMAELSGVAYGDRAVDLGSGDGRVVIELARRGAESHGYEINPALVVLSRWNVRRAGLSGRAHIHWRSFWRVDLGSFHAVTVFQGSFIMQRLERKVLRELTGGARIVSDYWKFPHVKPALVLGTMYLYRIGA
ncbi:MAG TPA: class I SAM-dependent methyltransferase [Spirochaetia bacterium]|nr:class I SAM-dependent methyltransferase [Spirochaetia bacterium]